MHGSSHAIALEIRRKSNEDPRAFRQDHIDHRNTFAFETTLRQAELTLRVADAASKAGFETEMHYIATDVEIHIQRVIGRALAGGHAASEPRLREMYAASIANVTGVIPAFDLFTLYDSTGSMPVVEAKVAQNQVIFRREPSLSP